MFNTFKRNIRDMDKILLAITVLMFIFGLLNIVTASSRESVVRYNTGLYYYFIRQSFMLSVGLVASLFIINIPTNNYRKWITPMFLLMLVLTLMLSFVGENVKGAQNWLPIPGIGSIQPSEFSKPVIIVTLSVLFEMFYKKLRKKNTNHWDLIGILLFVGLFIPILTFLQKDLGTMIIMVTIFGVLFLVSPILKKEKILTIICLIALAFVGGMMYYLWKGSLLTEAQLARFQYRYPCDHYTTGGYQICNGFIALNDGGLFGLGLGKSKQKYSYIPEPHTDSVFAIIAEENGAIFCTFIFFGYIVILYRILKLAAITNCPRNKYMCIGFATYIFMHIFINLGGLFAIIPLTGVPLTFFSYGGSYAIALVCSLAVVQRIHIETKNQKIKIR